MKQRRIREFVTAVLETVDLMVALMHEAIDATEHDDE